VYLPINTWKNWGSSVPKEVWSLPASIHVYTPARTHTHTLSHTHQGTGSWVYTHTHKHTNTHTHTHIRVPGAGCTHSHTNTHTHTHIRVPGAGSSLGEHYSDGFQKSMDREAAYSYRHVHSSNGQPQWIWYHDVPWPRYWGGFFFFALLRISV
jgi:hypothetical protein